MSRQLRSQLGELNETARDSVAGQLDYSLKYWDHHQIHSDGADFGLQISDHVYWQLQEAKSRKAAPEQTQSLADGAWAKGTWNDIIGFGRICRSDCWNRMLDSRPGLYGFAPSELDNKLAVVIGEKLRSSMEGGR